METTLKNQETNPVCGAWFQVRWPDTARLNALIKEAGLAGKFQYFVQDFSATYSAICVSKNMHKT